MAKPFDELREPFRTVLNVRIVLGVARTDVATGRGEILFIQRQVVVVDNHFPVSPRPLGAACMRIVGFNWAVHFRPPLDDVQVILAPQQGLRSTANFRSSCYLSGVRIPSCIFLVHSSSVGMKVMSSRCRIFHCPSRRTNSSS